ncbi:MAG TPA: protein-L-isoaspartate(D-aspartate) O-methyltransferase [Lacipirellulaceae bacterium]|nr:protein-L-isoaspartate(D-aspartate) O-methyltransferase [Lacipirellulaceae bacterium]
MPFSITALRPLRALLAAGLLAGSASAQEAADPYAAAREAMVAREIEAAGVANPRVLAAMRATPRHEFMPPALREYAYVDAALPIGDAQTISPPFIVAYMTQALDPQPTDRVLEIGAGSGYQAAVLSPLAAEVYTIEIVGRLGRRAKRTLARLGYKNVHVRVGDGFLGWPEHAPFDKIIVTCSPESIPQPLVDQLAEGGQMIIPVGQRYQQTLYRVTKRGGKLERQPLEATLFVPMTGAAEAERRVQPDPIKPSLFNGDFERLVGETTAPAGWHYLRQAAVKRGGGASGGYLEFANQQPGRSSQCLQGFAIDGRKVGELVLSCRARGAGLAPDPASAGGASVIISFFDARRAAIDYATLGPWTGDFEWRTERRTVAVPLAAREAIVAIGLHGGIGVLGLDDVEVRAAPADRTSPPLR